MIKLFSYINELDTKFSLLKRKKELKDYRIILDFNDSIICYAICNQDEISVDIPERDFIVVELVNEEDAQTDLYFNEIFKNPEKIILGNTRKRLHSILAPINSKIEQIPVITFYSYKGGVGRSTTLASCAFFLSVHYKKKVVVLDCDFEAPGFSNFYLEDPTAPIYSNGIIEYLLDSPLEDVSLKQYYWEASKSFSGDGEIYVFPAGNLNDNIQTEDFLGTSLAHYLNGLTRVDFTDVVQTKERMKGLLEHIKRELAPDVIMIDSRTGFNDIFGVSALQLSSMVVGFFGSDVQTRPGLHFFLDFLKQENAPRLLVVNSIMPDTNKREHFERFKETVGSYLSIISNKNNGDDDVLDVNMYYVPFNASLNSIGKDNADINDYIDLIKERELIQFNHLFDDINEFVDSSEDKNKARNNDIATNSHSGDNSKTLHSDISPKMKLKAKLLETYKRNKPELYAENIRDFQQEYDNNRYFYRKCMEDLFNPDKILVLGNKGTGKSYIYRSLKIEDIVNKLKKRASKNDYDYRFIHIVDTGKGLNTLKLDSSLRTSGLNEELYFERFWKVYIWNAIMLDSPFGFQSTFNDLLPIKDDTSTAKRFNALICDEDKIIEIEEELNRLDLFLNGENNKRIIIIFDDLDKIVKPILWSKRISPLINIARSTEYRNIFPKLFLRSDLYEKVSNLNNKNELKNRTISIEWTQEELFAYFFKLILSHSQDDFFELMKLYEFYPNSYVNKVIKDFERTDGQPRLDEYVLRHLCATFFGRYADVDNSPRFGESYDWFFRNLKNANGTISLRPFNDLISYAMDRAITDDKSDMPILPQKYYTNGNARAKAVENHFNDLAKEEGNEDLVPIFNYIRDKAGHYFKKETLTQQEIFSLLDEILNEGNVRDNKDRDSIISLLEVNGILARKIVRVGNNVHTNYQFAYLYKYYLGLKNPKRHRKHKR